jgi:hypothetical protein
VIYLTVLPQNVRAQPPTVEDLQVWASEFQLTSPVVSDPQQAWSKDATPRANYPVLLVADRELVVQERLEDGGDPYALDLQIRRAIERVGDIAENPEPPKSICTD